jgi:hypothetical protein
MTHDGFMLQVSLGFGYTNYNEKVTAPGFESVESTATGFTGSFNLLGGGTLTDGFVLGGGLMGVSVVDPTIEFEGGLLDGGDFETEDVSMGMSVLTLFGQWYPDPHGGLFIRGGIGFGFVSVEIDGDEQDVDMDGPVLSLAMGYGWWVSDQWSIGLEGQFVAGFVSDQQGNAEANGTWLSPTLNAVFTYH